MLKLDVGVLDYPQREGARSTMEQQPPHWAATKRRWDGIKRRAFTPMPGDTKTRNPRPGEGATSILSAADRDMLDWLSGFRRHHELNRAQSEVLLGMWLWPEDVGEDCR